MISWFIDLLNSSPTKITPRINKKQHKSTNLAHKSHSLNNGVQKDEVMLKRGKSTDFLILALGATVKGSCHSLVEFLLVYPLFTPLTASSLVLPLGFMFLKESALGFPVFLFFGFSFLVYFI